MKDSIGEKQVKVFMMKNFLIFIFTIFGLFVGWIAFMVYSYERSYNEWKSSYSGSLVTNSEKNTLLQVLVRSIMIIKNQMNLQVHMQKLSLCQKNLIYRNRKLNNI